MAATIYHLKLASIVGLTGLVSCICVNFVAEPTNVSVIEGDNAYFACEYSSNTRVRPAWRINGLVYSSNDLPDAKYSFNGTGLVVVRVNRMMNMWSHSCIIDTYTAEMGFQSTESAVGILFVYLPVTVVSRIFHVNGSTIMNCEPVT